LSRVIKSFSVQIQSPRVIENDGSTDSLRVEAGGSLETLGAGLAGLEHEQNVGHVKNQAREILQETEQMVKELIQTARQESEKIIANANTEAQKIINDGRDKLKQIEEEAFHHGWQGGYEEGHKVVEEEYNSKVQEAQNLVEKAHEEKQKIIAGSEDEVVQLAVAVSRKVIGRELATSPEIIVEIVKRAIQKVGDREELTVRVNPENMDSTINAQDEIKQSAKGVRKLKVLADPTIAPGGCVVESSNGTVDARVERQLGEIKQALMEVSPNA